MIALRDEVAGWLAEHWDPQMPHREWLELVVDAGYAVPTWRARWFGRDLHGADGQVIGLAGRARVVRR